MPTPTTAEPAQDHFRFRNGLFVHPLNPKAWVMCVLAWGKFAPALGDFSVQLPVIILTFAICQLCLHSLWCWLGTIMGKSLRNNVRLTRAMIISTVGHRSDCCSAVTDHTAKSPWNGGGPYFPKADAADCEIAPRFLKPMTKFNWSTALTSRSATGSCS